MQALGTATLHTPVGGGEGASYSRMSFGLDGIGIHGSFPCLAPVCIDVLNSINARFRLLSVSTASVLSTVRCCLSSVFNCIQRLVPVSSCCVYQRPRFKLSHGSFLFVFCSDPIHGFVGGLHFDACCCDAVALVLDIV
jgi:hypothetical protein